MHRHLFLLIVIVSGVFMLAGCGEKDKGIIPEKADLTHHRYEILTMDGKQYEKFHEMPAPYIEFGENFTVNGKICNVFRGQGTLENGTLKVAQMASTMMLCPNDQGNQLERMFNQLLTEGSEVRLDGEKLVIRGQGGELVYTLRDLVN